MTGAIPPGYLVTPAQLSRYHVPSAFLAQFAPLPFSILISQGGTLGTMQFQWQYPGDSAWSAAIVSTAGASWAYTIEDTFADLTFAARTYVLNETYTVDPVGTVTGDAGLTAVRFDLRSTACSAATAEAMTLMRDAIRPPLTTWGDDAVMHTAAMVYAILKRSRGATPSAAGGDGDVNVFSAETIARAFFSDIGANGKPDSMIDTSPTSDGPLLAAYPSGDHLRNW